MALAKQATKAVRIDFKKEDTVKVISGRVRVCRKCNQTLDKK